MSDLPERILCSDGKCIGTINEKGYCSICGKPLDTKQNVLQEETPSKMLEVDGIHIYYMPDQRAFQRIGELIGLIDEYFVNLNLNRQFSQESWDCITALCREMEKLIPETMRHVNHGVSLVQYDDRIDLCQLRTQLLKIVSNWRATPQMSEKYMIIDALNKANQNDKKAANLLGISRRTLRNKIKEYNLQSAAFAIPDLGLSGKYFTIQSDEGGQIYFQRDNSYLWSGTRSLTGRELCIHGPSTVL